MKRNAIRLRDKRPEEKNIFTFLKTFIILYGVCVFIVQLDILEPQVILCSMIKLYEKIPS